MTNISQLEFTAKASDMEIKEMIPTEYSVLMSSSLNWLILLMPVSYRTTGPMFLKTCRGSGKSRDGARRRTSSARLRKM